MQNIWVLPGEVSGIDIKYKAGLPWLSWWFFMLFLIRLASAGALKISAPAQ
jgi:hypothetical protein